MHLPISIVIPTLNEQKTLPGLLRSIQNQTMLPKEIIVADANSQDKTAQIAKKFGCILIKGGLPGKGRNNGAKKATQKIILFLDADVVLPPQFLERTFFEMMEKNLDITSCLVTPRSRDKKDKVIATLWNSYFLFLEKLAPHVCGFCIFVKKNIHTKIHGFDESILVAEDVDYVQRAVKIGAQFSFLETQKIPISLRRFIEEGRLKLIMKHVGITLHTLFIGQVRRNIFDYKFGQHEKS